MTATDENTALAPTAAAIMERAVPAGLEETVDLAKLFVTSKLFADSTSISQAVVKIIAGREYGFGPFASMRGLYIINGKLGMEANLMAQAIKRSPRYDFKVREITDQVCTIEFFEDGASVGLSMFTAADAKKAGTKNMDKFARNMLFARALSNGQRWYCPDVFGAPAYTVEEFDTEQRPDGTWREDAAESIPVPQRKSESAQ